MPGRSELQTPTVPTPDAIRRRFYERGDASLGLVPQLLLDEPNSELWAYFWHAARAADDAIEARTSTGADFAARMDAPEAESVDLALGRFLQGLPPEWDRATVKDDLRRALHALDRERAWASPPSLVDYTAAVRDKSGVPLEILNRLLLAGEEAPTVRRFSRLLAYSIQLGDDLRDRARDRAAGIHTITQDELDLARERHPQEADPMMIAIVPWREAASRWLAILALERAERMKSPTSRSLARIEVLLWIRSIDAGHLRTTTPLTWAVPLGDLLKDGPPSAARMAAARRVVQNEPTILGPAAKWDARERLQQMQNSGRGLPELYQEFERAAKPE